MSICWHHQGYTSRCDVFWVVEANEKEKCMNGTVLRIILYVPAVKIIMYACIKYDYYNLL